MEPGWVCHPSREANCMRPGGSSIDENPDRSEGAHGFSPPIRVLRLHDPSSKERSMPTCRPRFADRLTSFIVAAAATAGALVGAGGSEAAPLPTQTLVYCSDASPAGFDPAQYTTSVENSAAAYTVY